MPTFPPELSENLRSLQRQINRINLARPGPMSWGPDDGHIRFYDASGNVLFQADSSGASVVSRGALTGVTPLIDGVRSVNDQQDSRLAGHDSTLAAHDTRMDGIDSAVASKASQSYADGIFAAVQAKANTSTVDAKNAAQDSRMDGIDAAVASKASTSYVDGVWEAVQAKANTSTVNAKNASQDAAISAAQARADNAHTRIDGLNYATPAQIAQLQDLIQNLQGRVQALEDWRASLPQG